MSIKSTVFQIFLIFLIQPFIFSIYAYDSGNIVNIYDTLEYQQIKDLSLALDLLQYGIKNNDALSFIVSAQILRQSEMISMDLEKETKPCKTDEQVPRSIALDLLLSPDLMLERAVKIARQHDNLHIASLAEQELRLLNQRGSLKGPGVHKDRILPGDSDIFKLFLSKGNKAIVKVIGDGDCDLQLFIYDKDLNLITQNTESGDRLNVAWMPEETDNYYIKVKSLCPVWADYVVVINSG